MVGVYHSTYSYPTPTLTLTTTPVDATKPNPTPITTHTDEAGAGLRVWLIVAWVVLAFGMIILIWRLQYLNDYPNLLRMNRAHGEALIIFLL